MKKYLLSGLVLCLVVGMALAAGQKDKTMAYRKSGTSTARIVQATRDTTQMFQMWLYGSRKAQFTDEYPTELMIATLYASVNDSINVKVHLDLSEDGTNWFAYLAAAEDSALSVYTAPTADAYRVVRVSTSTMPHTQWGRLRLVGAVAAGDTVNVSQVIRFIY